MSWLGWLFLLAGLYVLVAVVRGLVQFVSWLIEECIVEPRMLRRLREKPPEGLHANPTATAPTHREAARASRGLIEQPRGASTPLPAEEKPAVEETKKAARPAKTPRWRRIVRWDHWRKWLRALSLRRGYDYWVACALAEDDLRTRVRYLAKAIQANPAYPPAWGMKGHALFELGQYDEAIACFDKSLELHPSALVWYRRGLCFQKKGEGCEALRCFGKAMEECRASDRSLMEEIARMKRRVEEQLRCVEAR